MERKWGEKYKYKKISESKCTLIIVATILFYFQRNFTIAI